MISLSVWQVKHAVGKDNLWFTTILRKWLVVLMPICLLKFWSFEIHLSQFMGFFVTVVYKPAFF